ncbi:tRNA methyltransferase 44 [Clydaea vesicula]|uniref:tRNA (uracil-O(2)-)-methyltransferase n=1 Tax=Clydaea vesicula TaxID=447962 RepID=A0AAD5U4Z3_9FUNG|nr:tRNA methyltransferase 44 [Clydaea vesicula]
MIRAFTTATLEHFLNVIDIWTKEPQYIIPPVLRGEIISDETFSNSSNNLRRIIYRKLIPKQPKRDKVVLQKISFYNFEHKKEYLVTYEPISMSDKEIEPSDLPFYYPKLKQFSHSYISIQNTKVVEDENNFKLTEKEKSKLDDVLKESVLPNIAELVFNAVPFEGLEIELESDRFKVIWGKLLTTFLKFLKNPNYEKRVIHDIIVPKINYQDRYYILKEKYSHWIEKWPESTDPKKHVFEDVAIATFLILMWEEEGQRNGVEKKQSFVDVGCGNGFLTYILTNEGYFGKGIDISKRKLWDMFDIEVALEERIINPREEKYEGFDWIIGNHPDELTLWIPIFAAKTGYNIKFIIIPCCFHKLSGEKFTESDPHYINHIDMHIKNAGYTSEHEFLRMPSTKNLAIISRKRIFSVTEKEIERDILENIEKMQSITSLNRLQDVHHGTLFAIAEHIHFFTEVDIGI